jgi:hypothetical protein
MDYIIVTNNPLVSEKYRHCRVERLEGSVLNLLLKVRDYIHQGHQLLTHPLSGSLKPGRIPFKTVIIALNRDGLDHASLHYIEAGLETYRKTVPIKPASWDEAILQEFALVDLSHLEAALTGLDY